MARVTIQEPIEDETVQEQESTIPEDTEVDNLVPTEQEAHQDDANNAELAQSAEETLQASSPLDTAASKARQVMADPVKRGVLLVALIVLAVGLFAVKNLYDKEQLRQEVARLEQAQTVSTANEAVDLKDKIARLLELPTDETPTVATVVDADKVREQAFFANSRNGDKILLFSTTGKAVLYRPATNKIVEIAPISLGDQSDQQDAESTDQDGVEAD